MIFDKVDILAGIYLGLFALVGLLASPRNENMREEDMKSMSERDKILIARIIAAVTFVLGILVGRLI